MGAMALGFMAIQVSIVEDRPDLRESLRALVNGTPGFAVAWMNTGLRTWTSLVNLCAKSERVIAWRS